MLLLVKTDRHQGWRVYTQTLPGSRRKSGLRVLGRWRRGQEVKRSRGRASDEDRSQSNVSFEQTLHLGRSCQVTQVISQPLFCLRSRRKKRSFTFRDLLYGSISQPVCLRIFLDALQIFKVIKVSYKSNFVCRQL